MASIAGYGGQSPLVSKHWHVYILKCSDASYYVGRSTDISDRLRRHSKGQVKYTSTRLPVELIVHVTFPAEWKAVLFEKYLKSGSGRAFSKRHFL